MRQLIVVGLAILVGGATASGGQGSPKDIWISIAPSQVGGGEGGIPVRGSEIYIQGPTAGVGAPLTMRPVPPEVRQNSVQGLSFSIRAWREGGNDRARAVVYATLDDKRAPEGRTETAIATFTIAPGQSVEVAETEKWGASRVVVKASAR